MGFLNLLPKTAKHLRLLCLPTLVGSVLGAELFIHTSVRLFDKVVPWLILLAACLLLFQPTVKGLASKGGRKPHPSVAALLQLLVALYGGYFGAGMGIMMLAVFALFMEGTVHELNAVKTWLGVIINFSASIMFVFERIIDPTFAMLLTIGSIIGGFYAAKYSQKVDPDKMRMVIAAYGLVAATYFMYKAFAPASWPRIP